MPRFNTAFLLKATAVTALACLPMAMMEKDGPIASAFLIPIALGILMTAQVEDQGEYEFKFKKLPDSIVEIYTTGGEQGRMLKNQRIFLSSGFVGFAAALTTVWLSDREPPEYWHLSALAFAAAAALIASCSTRILVDSARRAFSRQLLLFGNPQRFCWRWKVQEGDYLAVMVADPSGDNGTPQYRYHHLLYVCRGRRRFKIATGMFSTDRVIPGMEVAAQRVAKLLDIPYEGYQEHKMSFWWPL